MKNNKTMELVCAYHSSYGLSIPIHFQVTWTFQEVTFKRAVIMWSHVTFADKSYIFLVINESVPCHVHLRRKLDR